MGRGQRPHRALEPRGLAGLLGLLGLLGAGCDPAPTPGGATPAGPVASSSSAAPALPVASPARDVRELRQEIPVLLASWDLPQAQARYAELRAELGAEDPELLVQLAWRLLEAAVVRGEDWTPAERQEALGALGRTGRPAAVPLLGGLLAGGTWELRWSALEGLALFPTPEAGELLARGAADEDRRVRCAAGSLLLERDDPRGFKPALECGTPPALRYRALRLLLERAAQAPAEILPRVAHHEAQDPRVLLIALLARRALPAERALLVNLEKDPKPIVKRAARCALAVVDHAARDPRRALQPFQALLRGNAEAKATGILLLGYLGPRLGAAAVHTLAALLPAADPTTAGAICVALAHLGRPEAVPVLASVLQGPHPPDVQRKAAMALARLQDPAAIPLLRPLLLPQAAHPAVQSVVASALAALHDETAVPELQRLAAEPDPELATAAAAALAELHGQPAQHALRELLRSPFATVRSRAALGLGGAADPELLPLLARLLQDRERAVQYNAAASIVRLHDTIKSR